MPADHQHPHPAKAPRRLRIVVPKGFPAGAGWQTADFHAPQTRASRLSGPLGAFALHGALIVLLFHVQAMREVFGQRAVDEQEWTWLPDVALVAQPPATPPPPPVQELPSPPESEPLLETVAPIEVAPEEAPPETVPEPAPELPPPKVEPPALAAETADAADPEAWTEVRRGIVESLRYPAQARRSGMAGVVLLRLRLDETGRIVSAEIQPPAPAQPLCAAVLAAVRRAGPFPAVGEAIRAGRTPDRAELAIRFQLDDPAP